MTTALAFRGKSIVSARKILHRRLYRKRHIIFLARDRLSLISQRGIEGAPTLAVEILSPTTLTIDRQRELALYARHAVPWYWIVDPERREIEVHGLDAGSYGRRAGATGDETLRAEPFPDLALPLVSIWP